GIRDATVTGVQTCALPIFGKDHAPKQRDQDMTAAITVSERAARRIGEILKGEGDGAMLRISVEGGGCSGFQYKFDVDHAKAEDEIGRASCRERGKGRGHAG